jgi:hypothetical protein
MSDISVAAEDDNIPANNIPAGDIRENDIQPHSNPIDQFPSDVRQEFHLAACRPARRQKLTPSPM